MATYGGITAHSAHNTCVCSHCKAKSVQAKTVYGSSHSLALNVSRYELACSQYCLHTDNLPLFLHSFVGSCALLHGVSRPT